MASAQVVQNSRKQEHLEAGKRRLEEFRKKKAAEQAKKVAVPSQTQVPDGAVHEKQPSESEGVWRLTDSYGAGTSNGPGESFTRVPAAVIKNDGNAVDFPQKSERDFLNDTHVSHASSRNGYEAFSADLLQPKFNDQDTKTYGTSMVSYSVDANHRYETKQMNNDSGIYSGPLVRFPYGTASEQSNALRPQASAEFDRTSSQSSFHGVDELQSKGEISHLGKSTVVNASPSNVFSANVAFQRPGGILPHADPGFLNPTASSIEPLQGVRKSMHGTAESNDHLTSDFGGRKLVGSTTSFSGYEGAASQSSESAGFKYDTIDSSNYEPSYSESTENNVRRSRPSFLDSLNVPRSNSSKSSSRNVLGSSDFEKPPVETATAGPFPDLKFQNAPTFDNSMTSIVSSNVADLPMIGDNESSMERKHNFYSSKQNDDFAALEQHIEDLTQDKFSLQRALEASRALAESLASENSSLTDSYNQQRSVVEQLKSDMEALHEEIKARLVELESVKVECANAQLECHASDERAKLLASEVIGLEEKSLRLRSNELKLERQLENLQAEILSCKRKMSSLEKERQDMQSTIDALQEEKKLLQSKLRKASASGKSFDFGKTPNKKDMYTSTDDLENAEVSISNQEQDEPSGATIPPENGTSAFDVSSVDIPPDQIRMIQDINALISELSLEKEELAQALASESLQSSRLKELNKELSQKLEAQTQRLELLTAQSMAGETISARPPDSRTVHDDTTYADEGDEVVERVLGWIMKLFPGGPSRRRTSKLL